MPSDDRNRLAVYQRIFESSRTVSAADWVREASRGSGTAGRGSRLSVVFCQPAIGRRSLVRQTSPIRVERPSRLVGSRRLYGRSQSTQTPSQACRMTHSKSAHSKGVCGSPGGIRPPERFRSPVGLLRPGECRPTARDDGDDGDLPPAHPASQILYGIRKKTLRRFSDGKIRDSCLSLSSFGQGLCRLDTRVDRRSVRARARCDHRGPFETRSRSV